MKTRLWVLIATLVLGSAGVVQAASPDTPWLGVLWTKGGVSVGDASVSSGMTVVPGDVITTSNGASAWLRFRSPASTFLQANTQVTMLGSDSGPSLLLRRGTVVINENVAQPFQVSVAGGYVMVEGDPKTGAECELASLGNDATISVTRGMAEIHGAGAPMILHPGQTGRIQADQEGGQPVAGKVNRVIPQGVIQRQGQVQELPLQLNQVVNWNDLVRTLQQGRAQIMLVDGSTLNIGARSEIRVVKHDPQAQQTSIELTLGEVQANVSKITAPGGKFQLRTKSAVIGTIDTAFVAETDGQGTKVCGVSGTTLVGSSDPNITATVTLKKGECTFVPYGGAPTTPVMDPSLMASLLGQTAIAAPGGALLAGNTVWYIVGAAAVAGLVTGIVLATTGTTTATTVTTP
ncbi:MAG: FecR domain-containing protein [Terriglobia bacterium]